MKAARPVRSLVRHRKPAPLRRGGAAPGRTSTPERSRPRSTRRGRSRSSVVHKPVADERRVDPPALPRGERGRELRRADRVDAHVLAREDVDRRPRRAGEAAPPPAHAVQPRSPVGGDRHGLHEPEPVRARRPGVRVHRDADAAAAARRSSGTGSDPTVIERIGTWCAGGLRLARGADARGRPLRRQHAPGRGHRGRQGRGAAQARRLGRTATASASWSRRCNGVPDAEVDRLVARVRGAVRGRARAPARAASAASRCATRRESRPGLRAFLEAGGFKAFTDTFEDLAACRSCPGIAVQRLMADGYGFGAEGDWKTAALVRILKVMAAGLDGGTSFMEDYTYHLAPDESQGARRAHARGVPVDRRRSAVLRDPPALDRRQGGSGAARLHGRAGPAVVVSLVDLGDRFRLVANEVEVVAARTQSCRGCRSHGPCGSRSRTSRRPRRPGCSPAARTTRCFTQGARDRAARRPRRDRRARAPASSTTETRVSDVQEGAALEPGLLPPGTGPRSAGE